MQEKISADFLSDYEPKVKLRFIELAIHLPYDCMIYFYLIRYNFMKSIISLLVLSLFSSTLFGAGLKGLDANKFRWAETYLEQYQTTSGNSKSINKERVENYIEEIQNILDNNKNDPEYPKYKAQLDKLIAGLNNNSDGNDIPENIGDAKSNLYWAQGKIDYAFKDSYYGATEANLESAETYLNTAKKILFSGNYKNAAGEYKTLLDLYTKLQSDLTQLNAAK